MDVELEPWEPGREGKAMVFGSIDNPGVAIWATHDGAPHHYEVAAEAGIGNFIACEISPSGEVRVLFGDPTAAQDVVNRDPRLHVKEEEPTSWLFDSPGSASNSLRGSNLSHPTASMPQGLRTAENDPLYPPGTKPLEPGQGGGRMLIGDMPGEVHSWGIDYDALDDLAERRGVDDPDDLEYHHNDMSDYLVSHGHDWARDALPGYVNRHGQVEVFGMHPNQQAGVEQLVTMHNPNIKVLPAKEQAEPWEFTASADEFPEYEEGDGYDYHHYQPGAPGKGFVAPDGRPVTWNISGYGESPERFFQDAGPHHSEVAMQLGLPFHPENSQEIKNEDKQEALENDYDYEEEPSWHSPISIDANGNYDFLNWDDRWRKEPHPAFAAAGLRPKTEDWHFGSVAPKIIEHQFEGDMAGYEDYENRRPIIYDPDVNTIHVGPPGGSHPQLSWSGVEPYNPDFHFNDNREGRGYNAGWLGSNSENMLGRHPETEQYGWYGKVPSPEVDEALRNHFGLAEPNWEEQGWHFGGQGDFGLGQWEPGHHGKGLQLKDGREFLWKTNNYDGYPTHAMFVQGHGLHWDAVKGMTEIGADNSFRPANLSGWSTDWAHELADKYGGHFVDDPMFTGDWNFAGEPKTTALYPPDRNRPDDPEVPSHMKTLKFVEQAGKRYWQLPEGELWHSDIINRNELQRQPPVRLGIKHYEQGVRYLNDPERLEDAWKFGAAEDYHGIDMESYSDEDTPGPLLPWEQGYMGKAYINQNGQVRHWRTDKFEAPHHGDVMNALNDEGHTYTYIEPDGKIQAWGASGQPNLNKQYQQIADHIGGYVTQPKTWDFTSSKSYQVIDSDITPEQSYLKEDRNFFTHSPFIVHGNEIYLGPVGTHHADLIRHHIDPGTEMVANAVYKADGYGNVNNGLVHIGEIQDESHNPHEVGKAVAAHTGLPYEPREDEWGFSDGVHYDVTSAFDAWRWPQSAYDRQAQALDQVLGPNSLHPWTPGNHGKGVYHIPSGQTLSWMTSGPDGDPIHAAVSPWPYAQTRPFVISPSGQLSDLNQWTPGYGEAQERAMAAMAAHTGAEPTNHGSYWDFESKLASTEGVEGPNTRSIWWHPSKPPIIGGGPDVHHYDMADQLGINPSRAHAYGWHPLYTLDGKTLESTSLTQPELEQAAAQLGMKAHPEGSWGFEAKTASTILYHYSDPSNRESIRQNGLMPRHPISNESLAERDDMPAGVYLFADRHQADLLEGDTWAVNVDGLNLLPDPFHKAGAYYSVEPISPDRLILGDNNVRMQDDDEGRVGRKGQAAQGAPVTSGGSGGLPVVHNGSGVRDKASNRAIENSEISSQSLQSSSQLSGWQFDATWDEETQEEHRFVIPTVIPTTTPTSPSKLPDEVATPSVPQSPIPEPSSPQTPDPPKTSHDSGACEEDPKTTLTSFLRGLSAPLSHRDTEWDIDQRSEATEAQKGLEWGYDRHSGYVRGGVDHMGMSSMGAQRLAHSSAHVKKPSVPKGIPYGLKHKRGYPEIRMSAEDGLSLIGAGEPESAQDDAYWKAITLQDGTHHTWRASDAPGVSHHQWAVDNGIDPRQIHKWWGWNGDRWLNYGETNNDWRFGSGVPSKLSDQVPAPVYKYRTEYGPEEYATTTPWEPGHVGKGYVNGDGSVVHWKVNEHSEPHHWDIAENLGHSPQTCIPYIWEDGTVVVPTLADEEEHQNAKMFADAIGGKVQDGDWRFGSADWQIREWPEYRQFPADRSAARPWIADWQNKTIHLGQPDWYHADLIGHPDKTEPIRGAKGLLWADGQIRHYDIAGPGVNEALSQWAGQKLQEQNDWRFGASNTPYAEGDPIEPWELGNAGKGMFYGNKPVMWSLTDQWGGPHHHDVMWELDHGEQTPIKGYFHISPDGEVQAEGNGDAYSFAAHDPRLRVQTHPNDGWRFGSVLPPYKPGGWGKGYWKPAEDSLVTWGTRGGQDGEPTHAQALRGQNDSPEGTVYFSIHPEGQAEIYYPHHRPLAPELSKRLGMPIKEDESYWGDWRYGKESHMELPGTVVDIPIRNDQEGISGIPWYPLIHDPKSEITYRGGEGSYHADLVNAVPELRDQYMPKENYRTITDQAQNNGNWHGRQVGDSRVIWWDKPRGQDWHFGASEPQFTWLSNDGKPDYWADHSIIFNPQTNHVVIGHPGIHHADLYDDVAQRGEHGPDWLPAGIYDGKFETYTQHDHPGWNPIHEYFNQFNRGTGEGDLIRSRTGDDWHFGAKQPIQVIDASVSAPDQSQLWGDANNSNDPRYYDTTPGSFYYSPSARKIWWGNGFTHHIDIYNAHGHEMPGDQRTGLAKDGGYLEYFGDSEHKPEIAEAFGKHFGWEVNPDSDDWHFGAEQYPPKTAVIEINGHQYWGEPWGNEFHAEVAKKHDLSPAQLAQAHFGLTNNQGELQWLTGNPGDTQYRMWNEGDVWKEYGPEGWQTPDTPEGFWDFTSGVPLEPSGQIPAPLTVLKSEEESEDPWGTGIYDSIKRTGSRPMFYDPETHTLGIGALNAHHHTLLGDILGDPNMMNQVTLGYISPDHKPIWWGDVPQEVHDHLGQPHSEDWRFSSAPINVVELPPDPKYNYGQSVLQTRRPMIWADHDRTLYIGHPGWHHTAIQDKADLFESGLHYGWIDPTDNQDRVNAQREGEYGWYNFSAPSAEDMNAIHDTLRQHFNVQPHVDDWHFGAQAPSEPPTIIELGHDQIREPSDHDYSQDWDMETRRPFVWHPQNNEVVIGPPGAYHSQIDPNHHGQTGAIFVGDNWEHSVNGWGRVPERIVQHIKNHFGYGDEPDADWHFAAIGDWQNGGHGKGRWEEGYESLPWTLEQYGKGFIHPTGTLHTWAVQNEGSDSERVGDPFYGQPHHNDVLNTMGEEWDESLHPFLIDPDGKVTTMLSQGLSPIAQDIINRNPKLYVDPNDHGSEWKFSTFIGPSNSFPEVPDPTEHWQALNTVHGWHIWPYSGFGPNASDPHAVYMHKHNIPFEDATDFAHFTPGEGWKSYRDQYYHDYRDIYKMIAPEYQMKQDFENAAKPTVNDWHFGKLADAANGEGYDWAYSEPHAQLHLPEGFNPNDEFQQGRMPFVYTVHSQDPNDVHVWVGHPGSEHADVTDPGGHYWSYGEQRHVETPAMYPDLAPLIAYPNGTHNIGGYGSVKPRSWYTGRPEDNGRDLEFYTVEEPHAVKAVADALTAHQPFQLPPHEFKPYQKSYIPEDEDWRFGAFYPREDVIPWREDETVQPANNPVTPEEIEPWAPGQFGKFIGFPDGYVHAWRNQPNPYAKNDPAHAFDGWPSHYSVREALGRLDQPYKEHTFGWIDPDGQARVQTSNINSRTQQHLESLQRQYPNIKWPKDDWKFGSSTRRTDGEVV